MVSIVFYEKPGCINNTKQKQILRAAGVELDVRNLLTEAWTAERLALFFAGKAVADWFNRSAPQVKSGFIDPESITADAALIAMVSEPLLIRRPLIEKGDFRCSGFTWPELATHLQLTHLQHKVITSNTQDLETCPREQHSEAGCAVKESGS